MDLPEDYQGIKCQGCGRGEHRDAQNNCVYCEEGYYQDIDNHHMEVAAIQNCKKCEAGHYAPMIKEFGHFESWPKLLKTSCEVASPIGDPRECDVNPGWHLNNLQLLDSSGKRGLPQGLKFSMKGFVQIQNLYGSNVEIQLRMKGFNENEYFRVLTNGGLQYTSNQNTPQLDRAKIIELGDATDGSFISIFTDALPFGNNSIEISVLSEFTEKNPDFVSSAQVEIKRISFNGTIDGAARECIPVADGWYAPALSSAPLKCDLGHQPSIDKSHCVRCPDDSFNPQ